MTSSDTATELTIIKLNKVITSLRSITRKAITFVVRRLRQQLVRYRRRADVNEKRRRRAEHCFAELRAVRNLPKAIGLDEVIKFALLNVKKFEELYEPNKTPVDKLAIYKVVTSTALVTAVDKVRREYLNWHQEIPFILQRFGQQARQKKLDKGEAAAKKEKVFKSTASSEENTLAPKEKVIEVSENFEQANLQREIERKSVLHSEEEDSELHSEDSDEESIGEESEENSDPNDSHPEESCSSGGELTDKPIAKTSIPPKNISRKPREFGARRMKPIVKKLNDDSDDDFFANNNKKNELPNDRVKSARYDGGAKGPNSKRVADRSYAQQSAKRPVKPKAKETTAASLHPSWEAAKRKKEQIQAALRGRTAKRIKFKD